MIPRFLRHHPVFQSLPVWVILYFSLFFVIGGICFSDYGISTDETQQRLIGQTSLQFLSHVFHLSSLLKDTIPLTDPSSVFLLQKDRDYGVIFELPAEYLVSLFQLEGANIFYFRHWLTFFVFFISSIFFYKTIRYRYQNWRWGLLATTVLILSPRIFGDAFFNDKDLVFLSLFIITSYTLIRFQAKPSLSKALYHALACAVAIDTRIMGILIPILTLGIMALQLWTYPKLHKRILLTLGIYLVATTGLVVLFWPWLWQDPIGNLLIAFKNMARFRHIVDMVFMGGVVSSGKLPWTYVPVWLGVTTPLLYSVLFFVGLATIGRQTWKGGFQTLRDSGPFQDLIFLILFFAPLAAVIVLHSVLYNGWRQMYFIYPAFVVIATRGLVALWNVSGRRKILKPLLVLTVSLSFSYTAYWMVRWHPYQYLYFNVLAGQSSKRFDVDYWGVAYREPVLAILNQDPTKKYAIYDAYSDGPIFDNPKRIHWGYWQLPHGINILNLSLNHRARIIGDRTEACSDYVFTTVMGNRQQYLSNKPEFAVFHELKVDGQIVYTTFKRNVNLYEYYQPALGKSIDFSNRNTQCFLEKDWGQNESWGVWSTGPDPQLALFMPSGTPKTLTLDLRAFINPQHPSQEVNISINGVPQKTVTLNKLDNNQIELAIPVSAYGKEWISLGFTLPQAISPKELGMGDDGRKLGIGLKRAVFR